MSYLEKIREKVRHGLVLQWLSDRLTRVGIEITPFYWIKENGADALPKWLQEKDFEEFVFEELGPADREIAAAAGGDGFVPLEEIGGDVSSPHVKCFALKHHGDIACFTWFNLRECSSYLRPMPLQPNEAYIFATYAKPHYRGRNLAPYLRSKAMHALETQGKNVFFSISVCFNRASINFKKKLEAEFLELHIRAMLFRKFGFRRRIKRLADAKVVERRSFGDGIASSPTNDGIASSPTN